MLFWHPLKLQFIKIISANYSLLQSKQQISEQKQNPCNTIDHFLFMFLSVAFCWSET